MALIKIKRSNDLSGTIDTDYVSYYDKYKDSKLTRAKLSDGSYIEFYEPTYQEFYKIMDPKKDKTDWLKLAYVISILVMLGYVIIKYLFF